MKSLRDIIINSAEKYGDNVALKIKRKNSNTYDEYTFDDILYYSRKLSNYLIRKGYKKGDKIGIMGRNSPEWSIAFFAIQLQGFITIPIDRLLEQNEIKHILNDSELKALFLDEKYATLIEEIEEDLEFLNEMFILDYNSKNNIYDLMDKTNEEFPLGEIKRNEEAVYLYTSGTTGKTKGVILTHNNIISNITDIEKRLKIYPEDNFLSFLPVNHAYELTAGFLTNIYSGSTLVFSPSLTSRDIIKTMKEASITKMIGVPLIFEKIYNSINRKIKKMSKFKRFFIKLLFFIGKIKRKFDKSLNGTKFIFKPILKKIGFENVKFFVSGGAALPPYISKFFYLMGVPILQGYGLTETAPVLSCVSPKDIDFCSVGSPLENIKIRIYNPDDSGIGEIVARGPNIMKGYYKEKKKTKEVLKRGWFYTGDFGYLKDEKLYIKGRLKNVIVSKGGKNIYPEEIEEKLLESDFIEEVLVIGDGEPEAIIYPNYEEFDVLAQQNEQQEITDEYIYDVLKDEINEMNKLMAGYKRIRNIKLRKEEFPKTSTRKIKRYLFMEDKRKV